jgi:hypothetical protein
MTTHTTAPALHAALIEAAESAPASRRDAKEYMTFSFAPAPGVRSSFRILASRPRLLERAEMVRKHPALYGGGRIAKPETTKRARSEWPIASIRAWRALVSDGDRLGIAQLAENLGARRFEHRDRSIITHVAPMPVPGAPVGSRGNTLCTWLTDRGRWIVACSISGLGVRLKRPDFASRAAAESAFSEWLSSSPGASDLATALDRAPAVDQSAMLRAWCERVGIVDQYLPPAPVQDATHADDDAPDAFAVDSAPENDETPAQASTDAADDADSRGADTATAQDQSAPIVAHRQRYRREALPPMRSMQARKPENRLPFAHAGSPGMAHGPVIRAALRLSPDARGGRVKPPPGQPAGRFDPPGVSRPVRTV